MTPVKESTDVECLRETLHYLKNTSQVDPKMMLTLMSRRPFSQMWADLKSNADYIRLFETFMSFNAAFIYSYQVPQRLKDINYAEQFFEPSTGKPKDLSTKLSAFFNEEFYKENEETLFALLSKGVISTAMIRNFKKEIKLDNSTVSVSEILSHYYVDAIRSVRFPEKRYIVDTVDYVIKSTDFKHDVLSPPHLLNEENSMGNFKDITNHDSQFGEAVIEVRGIRDVQPWFLKKCRLDESVSGKFLTSPDERLITHGTSLLVFLSKFGTSQDFQDIALAMPFSLRKYD